MLEEYGISKGTIKTWIHKVKHPELVSGLKQRRPRKDEMLRICKYYDEVIKEYNINIVLNHKFTKEEVFLDMETMMNI